MDMNNDDEKVFLTVGDLAELLRVSTRTVHRLKDAGVIRAYRITPYCIRFDQDEVLEQLLSQRESKYGR